MIKQELTPIRKKRIIKSVSFMAIMAEMIKMEYLQDMDTRFKNPQVNMFAGRIVKDAKAIQLHLATNDKVNIRFNSMDFIENYAGELHRVVQFFIGLEVAQIHDIMNQLYEQAEAVKEEGDE